MSFPGLATDQRIRLDEHAQRAFGMPLTDRVTDFDQFAEGMVVPITVRHFGGYVPLNPQLADVRASLGGGYTQEHVTHTLAFIDRRLSDDEVLVKLPRPHFFSHKSGALDETDTFSLFREGGVMVGHYPDGAHGFGHFRPTWAVTRLPVLPVVNNGILWE